LELITSYSQLLSNNTAIWSQAIMMGVLVVFSGGLIGFLISTSVTFFKMLSR